MRILSPWSPHSFSRTAAWDEQMTPPSTPHTHVAPLYHTLSWCQSKLYLDHCKEVSTKIGRLLKEIVIHESVRLLILWLLACNDSERRFPMAIVIYYRCRCTMLHIRVRCPSYSFATRLFEQTFSSASKCEDVHNSNKPPFIRHSGVWRGPLHVRLVSPPGS